MSELLSAFLGALVGGFFSLCAARHSYRLAAEEKALSEATLLRDTAKLVIAEITTAFEIYMAEYGSELLEHPPGAPYVSILPIGANPFPVYDSAPACLSRLDPDLAASLVRLYLRAKGLIRMIELNNRDAERARDYGEEKLRHYAHAIATPPDEAATQQLQELFDTEVLNNAEILGMGSTADGMRGVTSEIQLLLASVQSRVAALAEPTAKRANR
ncbi:hypothetical protein [Stutzerimonas nitrititolerans]|uniref:hypothetical protein n=1 Tax=Stutzerimonas nitrititolerans TaxID=2482751 RepID=UPI0028A8C2DB|nr:hypothetical protein [Stutzerimonas nitrititolerans]